MNSSCSGEELDAGSCEPGDELSGHFLTS